ncbi:MAG: hypothetical protein J0M08_02100 [Bacteroidetes bacterium]|nr:hypothetical protein [Bacteroidota bacterium]
MRRFLKILAWCFGLLLVFLFSVVALGFLYEKEIKQYAIKELNNYLLTPVFIEPENINFTFLRSFPNAALEFRNVKALEVPSSNVKNENAKVDTLFSLGFVGFEFNIIDVFKKKYNIKSIKVSDGYCHTKIFRDGSDNFHFLKTTDSLSVKESSAVSFDVKSMVFEKIRITHTDFKSDFKLDSYIEHNTLSGNFKEKIFDLKINGSFLVNNFTLKKTSYVSAKNIDLGAVLKISESDVLFKDATVVVNDKLKFDVVGKIIPANTYTDIDVSISGKKLDLISLLALVPKDFSRKFSDYSNAGNVAFSTTIKGVVSDTEMPIIKGLISVVNGSISHKKVDSAIDKINFDAEFLYEKHKKSITSEFKIQSFSCRIKNNPIAGSIIVTDFANPEMDLFLKGLIDLETISSFVPDSIAQSFSGQLSVLVYYKGKLADINSFPKHRKTASEVSGRCRLVNVKGDFKMLDMSLDSLSGDFLIEPEQLVVSSVSGILNKTKFSAKGFLKNLIPAIVDTTVIIQLSGLVEIDKINLNNTSSGSSGGAVFYLPTNLNGSISFTCNKFNFKKFEATAISGELDLKNQQLFFHPVRMNTADGEVSATGFFDTRDVSNISLVCESTIDKVNLTKVFNQFDNFGQQTLSADNIKGIATADISLQAFWDKSFTPKWDKLITTCNLTIDKGELIKYEPLRALSKYIKLSELEHIKFFTLKNQIDIRNEKIVIPKMDVKSTAIDIVCSGMHGFDNSIDYKIKLYLNDILSKKAKKAKRENDEFGQVEDDGLGKISLFVLMTGTVDNPIIKYDRKSAFNYVKQDMQKEKQEIRKIFKEEFGKDNSKSEKKEQESDKIKVIWKEDKKDANGKDEDDDF